MSWRPKDWPENSCNSCDRKVEDEYGLLCDISCGKYSAFVNFETGADAMLEAIIILDSIAWKKFLDCVENSSKEGKKC